MERCALRITTPYAAGIGGGATVCRRHRSRKGGRIGVAKHDNSPLGVYAAIGGIDAAQVVCRRHRRCVKTAPRAVGRSL